VTDGSTASPTVWWRRWLPWGLLAISLAFNLMFVVGLMHHRGEWRGGHRDHREQALKEAVGLTDAQLAAMRDQKREIRSAMMASRRQMFEARADLMAHLAQAEPDEAAIEAALQRATDLRAEQSRMFIDGIRHFARDLSPEQRARFFRHFAEKQRDRADKPFDRR